MVINAFNGHSDFNARYRSTLLRPSFTQGRPGCFMDCLTSAGGGNRAVHLLIETVHLVIENVHLVTQKFKYGPKCI